MTVAQRLLESIQDGTLRPGDRLSPDRTLAVDFGISRTTVREALLALELLGVVEIRHGSGVYVLDPSARVAATGEAPWFVPSTTSLFEARTTIEPKIAQLCAVRLKPAEIRRISSVVTKAKSAVTRDTGYSEFSELQMTFHRMLAEGCGSPVLGDTALHMISIEEHPLWALLNQQALRNKEARMEQVVEHVEILEHIKNRDAEAARERMHRHVTDLGCTLIGTDWIP